MREQTAYAWTLLLDRHSCPSCVRVTAGGPALRARIDRTKETAVASHSNEKCIPPIQNAFMAVLQRSVRCQERMEWSYGDSDAASAVGERCSR